MTAAEFETLLLNKFKEQSRFVARSMGLPVDIFSFSWLSDQDILDALRFEELLNPGSIEEMVTRQLPPH